MRAARLALTPRLTLTSALIYHYHRRVSKGGGDTFSLPGGVQRRILMKLPHASSVLA